jgi:hypothetical protein
VLFLIFRNSLARDPKSVVSSALSCPGKGRIAIVTERGAGCDGRDGVERRATPARTAKSRGSGAPMQALSQRNDSLVTVATKHGHREEREGNR